MGSRRDYARSHGAFDAVAGATVSVPIGAGDVVQLVTGDQPGLLLCWQNPAAADFTGAGAIEADRPDVSIEANVDSVWLKWPDTLLSTVPVRLRSWSVPPATVPPPWPRSGMEQVEHLAEGDNVTITGLDLGKVLFDSEDVQREPGTIELRRFSSVTVWCSFVIDGTTTTGTIDLVLEIQSDGVWWAAYSSPGGRNAVWQHGPGVTPGTGRRLASATWPIPFARWRIRLNHSVIPSALASYHVYRSSSLFARQTV